MLDQAKAAFLLGLKMPLFNKLLQMMGKLFWMYCYAS
jgi:hypothetical protein